MMAEEDLEFVYPYQDIFQEASYRGMDTNTVKKLIDEWEKKYADSPETLDDLIDGVLE